MSYLLKKATSPEILDAAWLHYRNDKAAWRQGIPRYSMEKRVAYHLLTLARELASGAYQPDLVRFFSIHKAGGGSRLISAYTLRDKLAQRAVLGVLEPLGERLFHRDSYGYRSGRNIDMVFARIEHFMRQGFVWVVDADIRRFFDSIPRRPLLQALLQLTDDREVVALVGRWLDVGTYQQPETAGIKSSTVGIPQGAVISPFLCNLYLTALDWEMGHQSWPFVRFADDFLVFAGTREEAVKAMRAIDGNLRRLGLALNNEKTLVTRCGHAVTFLGRPLPEPEYLRKAGRGMVSGLNHGGYDGISNWSGGE